MLSYNKKLKEPARELRENMTDAERCLWARLRLKHLGYMFCRQKPIGDYIVDFYCHKARLVVEVDGGQHFTEDAASNDRVRDEYMRSLGLTVFRFSNSDVLKKPMASRKQYTSFWVKSLIKTPLIPLYERGTKEKGWG
jgi:very-short-patch-repair endonuclease